MASVLQQLYGARVQSPFACVNFNDTSAEACTTVASAADAAALLVAFENPAPAITFFSTFGLTCQQLGPAPFDDSIALQTCDAAYVQEVPCHRPKPPNFPFNCSCSRIPGTTPFSLSTTVSKVNYGATAFLYLFQVLVDSAVYPASTDIAYKAEFYLDYSQRQYIRGYVAQGEIHAPSWGSTTIAPNTFKIVFPYGGVTLANAAGYQVGIVVDQATTLSALSVYDPLELQYAIFSNDLRFCPQMSVYPTTAD